MTRSVEGDFSRLTEAPGLPMAASQLSMAHARYRLAVDHITAGGLILEIGCGTGFGLDFLSGSGLTVAAGLDITHTNLLNAIARYPHLPLARADGCRIPIRSASVDLALLLETIYYFPDVHAVLKECSRVLAPAGKIVVSLPNRQCRGFHVSPLSTFYPNAEELRSLLEAQGFHQIVVYGAFPIAAATKAEALVLAATSAAKKFHVVPTTLAGRARIKRLLYRNVGQFDGLSDLTDHDTQLTCLDPGSPGETFRVLYAVARVAGSADSTFSE